MGVEKQLPPAQQESEFLRLLARLLVRAYLTDRSSASFAAPKEDDAHAPAPVR